MAIDPFQSDAAGPPPPPDPSRRAPRPRERLPLSVKLAFGAPSFGLAAMGFVVAIHLTKFYADVVLAPLGSIAVAIAVARAFDAITDPMMGWLSDHTRGRFGRRRPWLAIGAPLVGASFYLLMSPPELLSPTGAAFWFGVCFLVFFLFDTACAIPHNALGPELTLDYHERSSLYGWRGGATMLGLLLAAVAPGAIELFTGNARDTFAIFGAFCGGLVAALFLWLVLRIRERPDFAPRESSPLVPGVRRALRNRPFRILLFTYIVMAIAGAMPGLLVPFLNEYVLRPENPELWLSIGLGTYVLSGLLFLPVWVQVSRRIGKRATWLATIGIGLVFNASAWFLGEGDMVPALILFGLAGVQFGATFMIGPSIQADAIDYDELYTGKRREAQYGSFWAIVPKFVAIPAAAVPVALLGWIGYVPNQPQTPEVVLTIRVLFALVPAFFSFLGLLVAWRFPISEPIHRAILDGIDRHRRGESAVDPITGAVVPPPSAREIDEETAWFLDFFSQGELRRARRHGPARLRHDVGRAAGVSLFAFAGLLWLAVTQVGDPGSEPTVWAAPAVAMAGLALTAVCFHLLRLSASRRARRARLSSELLGAHLRAVAGRPGTAPGRTGSSTRDAGSPPPDAGP